MKKRTKIVCTVGPAVASKEKLIELVEAGMNVARINFSHGTHEEHANTIALLKEVRQELGVPLAIMLDTKGPEIRLGKLASGSLELKEGMSFWLVKAPVLGSQEQITLTPSEAIDCLKIGMTVLLDDGYITTQVTELKKDRVKVQVVHGGMLHSTKGVNIPGVDLELPMITEKDFEDIRFGCAHDVDYIAASFVRSREQVLAIRRILEKDNKSDIAIIAKIENREGVENIDHIIQAADGIMIARGDLGVELPLTVVPRLQKMMIRKCYLAGKPSITATQMLESMIVHARPTRAEASDVANAIYDSTSVVMLSGETAVGAHPIEALKTMCAIIEETERDFDYYAFVKQNSARFFPDVPSSVALACINTAYSTHARVIFAFTTTGLTARLLSRFRPQMPIIAMTTHPKVYHQLALIWGVIPLLCSASQTIEEATARISSIALERGYVKYGDLVVMTAGTPFGRPGTTNMMVVDSVGDVLIRGYEGYGVTVSGEIFTLDTEHAEEHPIPPSEVQGKIIVISECTESLFPILQGAVGVILQNHPDDRESEWHLRRLARVHHLSILLRAQRGFAEIYNGQMVTLDPERAIVYKKSV